MYNLGERIRTIRLSKEISAEQLAKMAGVSQSTISRIEGNVGSPSLDNLYKICDVLEITIVDLFQKNNDNLPPDLLNLIITAKKLTPNQRKKLTEMIESFIK